MPELVVSVSEFVALLNQTLAFAYPNVTIVGELANFRVSKGKWVYFDLKDELASVKFFGTVYQLPGPLEDGLMLEVRGAPQLHPLYGFSVTVQTMRPVGTGSLKRAASLLEAKLAAEGLFDDSRKRPLPELPRHIGLITSSEAAAYGDFTKVLAARWGGVEVTFVDVQVQGEAAIEQLTRAIEYLNTQAALPEVLVITRGGGSAEDLAAFGTESVVRAIAASRVPTLVAIGHERDISLAELAADARASTPSNAAELLVPDKRDELRRLEERQQLLGETIRLQLKTEQEHLKELRASLPKLVHNVFDETRRELRAQRQLLTAFSPQAVLRRGYAIVHSGAAIISLASQLQPPEAVTLQFYDGIAEADVSSIKTAKKLQ